MIYGAGRLFPVSSPALTDGALRVKGGRIAEVGALADLRRAYPKEPLVSRPDCILMPGLVNAHTHLEYSALRHLAKPSAFRPWLRRLVEDSLLRRRFWGRGHWTAAAARGARLALSSGTTTVGDIVSFGAAPAAARSAGIRMRAFVEVVAHADDSSSAAIAAAEKTLAGRDFSSPLVRPGIAPHSIYTLSRRCLKGVADFSASANLPVSVHIAESPAEKELLSARGSLADHLARWDLPFGDGRKRTFLGYLADCGLVGPRSLLVHAVHLDGTDLALARRAGTTMAACCRSNEMLRCGSPPLGKWRSLGIPFAYGTDSLASAPDLDLFAEARATLASHPSEAVEAVRRLTLGGAEALGFDDITGSLAEGKEADFIYVELEDARSAGEARLLAGASAGAVVSAHIGGRQVYRRKRNEKGSGSSESGADSV